jgi:heptosyltransferase-3
MDTVLERLPSGSRVAVIRLRSLGDCVLTTPALALLKGHRPDLKITMVVERRYWAVFEGNPDVYECRSSAARADLALNLHGGTRSMALTAASLAKFRAGFAHHRYSFLYSTKIPTAQEILGVKRRVHTAEHLASAVFFLGVPQTLIPRARLFSEAPPDLPPYAVIHPFASRPDKAWPAERFTAVGRHLRERFGLEPVFLAGPADDPKTFLQFRVWRNEPLERVKSLLSGAQIFVGNDSGPAHVAAAFGVPVVALFGASDSVTWAPWRTEGQVLTAPGGIGNVPVEDVISAVEACKVRA